MNYDEMIERLKAKYGPDAEYRAPTLEETEAKFAYQRALRRLYPDLYAPSCFDVWPEDSAARIAADEEC